MEVHNRLSEMPFTIAVDSPSDSKKPQNIIEENSENNDIDVNELLNSVLVFFKNFEKIQKKKLAEKKQSRWEKISACLKERYYNHMK